MYKFRLKYLDGVKLHAEPWVQQIQYANLNVNKNREQQIKSNYKTPKTVIFAIRLPLDHVKIMDKLADLLWLS